jgi:HEAT repeat protein
VDPDVRYYATLVASEFVSPDLVQPVGRRLYDSDPGVRSGAYRALSVLYACEAEFTQLIERLRAGARDGRKLHPQVTAIEALGRLRDVESFQFFVSLLDSPQAEVARAAHASLVRLSCQDFGTSKKKWLAWLDKNDSLHRLEWLIDALMHSDERLRRRASDELKHLTQEYFGYHPGLPKREREAARQKYRRWWQQVGRRMFMQPEHDDSGQVRGQ